MTQLILPGGGEWKQIFDWQSLESVSSLTLTFGFDNYKRIRIIGQAGRETAAADGVDLMRLSINAAVFDGQYTGVMTFINGGGGSGAVRLDLGNYWNILYTPKDPLSSYYYSQFEIILTFDQLPLARYMLYSRGVAQYSTVSAFVNSCTSHGALETPVKMTSLRFSNSAGAAWDAKSKVAVYGSRTI